MNSKFVDTPTNPNVKLLPNQREPLLDPEKYRRLVGKLNYLTVTRLDISFAVSVVSQYLNSLCEDHWNAVIRILKYIKCPLGKGLLYGHNKNTKVVYYLDADWAGSPSDRRSFFGYYVSIGDQCYQNRDLDRRIVDLAIFWEQNVLDRKGDRKLAGSEQSGDIYMGFILFFFSFLLIEPITCTRRQATSTQQGGAKTRFKLGLGINCMIALILSLKNYLTLTSVSLKGKRMRDMLH